MAALGWWRGELDGGELGGGELGGRQPNDRNSSGRGRRAWLCVRQESQRTGAEGGCSGGEGRQPHWDARRGGVRRFTATTGLESTTINSSFSLSRKSCHYKNNTNISSRF
ncbi:hypothetical protein U1Q18_036621 [Sarracenia purpurea var. burkii]